MSAAYIATTPSSASSNTVPNGGTGAASFTAFAPIFGGTTSTGALQSGTVGTAGQVLTSNGAGAIATFQAAAAGSSGANPTASVGLAAVNGAAVTFMRSDGAPALDQSIAPTMTGQWIFSKAGAGSAPGVTVSGAPFLGTGTTSTPQLLLQPTGTTVNTGWSTAGTFLGVNWTNGAFAGNIIDCGYNGTRIFVVTAGGVLTVTGQINGTNINGTGFVSAGTTSLLGWASGVYMSGVSAAVFKVANNAQTSGYQVSTATNNTMTLLTLAGAAGGGLVAGAGTFSALLTASLGLTVTGAAFTLTDRDMVLGTTTGTKFGTATTQKLSFYNATPVVQPTAVADATGGAVVDTEGRAALNALLARLRTLGLLAP